MSEALMRAERIGDRGQRLAQMRPDHVAVGNVVGHLAQPVHVVGKREQPRLHIRQKTERVAHHRGAHHLAERADMRQAGRAVAGLEQHIAFFGRFPADPGENFTSLFKGPGAALAGGQNGRRVWNLSTWRGKLGGGGLYVNHRAPSPGSLRSPPSPARGEGSTAHIFPLSPCGRGRGPRAKRVGGVRGASAR